MTFVEIYHALRMDNASTPTQTLEEPSNDRPRNVAFGWPGESFHSLVRPVHLLRDLIHTRITHTFSRSAKRQPLPDPERVGNQMTGW